MFTGVKPDNSLVHSPTNILVVLMEQDGEGWDLINQYNTATFLCLSSSELSGLTPVNMVQ
jgi:hypothetical protein